MKKGNNIPTKQEIEKVHRRIAPFLHHTPVFTCESIDEKAGGELFFKAENLQKVGAFKARGAMNAVLVALEKVRPESVATHSSGNHAQALAYAAKKNGIPAYIVMPKTAPKVKKEAVLGYGATVIECEPTLEARESTLEEVVQKYGSEVVHPYNDYRVIAGQATAAKELFEEHELDNLVTPVGGGGLLSGSLLSALYFSPKTKVYAGEPDGANDAWKSLKEGRLIPSVNPNTIADGLLTSLGDKTYPIIRDHVTDIFCVNDEEIKEAQKLVWQRMKLVIEPSSAVALAAILKNMESFAGQRTGVIISGGNVDF